MIEVIVLGSGTGVPYLRRSSSGYCVKIDGEPILFEMGAGTVRRLLEAGIDYRSIRHLFITHRHPDHCADLVPYLFALNYTPGFKRQEPLELYGPAGFSEIVRKMMDLFPWTVPKHYRLDIKEVERGEIKGGNWKITSRPVMHGDVLAVSYRVESGGKVVVYSGDSGYCEELIENAKNADLFIVECSFPEKMELKGVHLNTQEVAEIANKAGAKRLVLTHLYPFCDEAGVVEEINRTFPGKVEKGEDLARIVL